VQQECFLLTYPTESQRQAVFCKQPSPGIANRRNCVIPILQTRGLLPEPLPPAPDVLCFFDQDTHEQDYSKNEERILLIYVKGNAICASGSRPEKRYTKRTTFCKAISY